MRLAARHRGPYARPMQSNDSERIADLERKVDYLIRYLGIDPAHTLTGASLAEAKYAVDSIARGL